MDGEIPMRGLKGSCHANPEAGQKSELSGQGSGGLYRSLYMDLTLRAFYSGERNSSPL